MWNKFIDQQKGYSTIEYLIAAGILFSVAYVVLKIPIDSMEEASGHVADAINNSVEWVLRWKD